MQFELDYTNFTHPQRCVCNTFHQPDLHVQIDAEKSPYLTEKLNIWMLPTLALIKNEKVSDYVVGLDDLGGTEDFTTETLEARLAAADVLHIQQDAAPTKAEEQRSVRKGGAVVLKGSDDEDSDFD